MSGNLSEQELVELNALIDGELDPAATATLKARIAEEPTLRSALDAIMAAREAIGRLPRPVVSEELRARIDELASRGTTDIRGRAHAARAFGWRSLAASIMLSALIASGATYWLVGAHSLPLDGLIAAAHRRSLLAASPVDVASSDRHTVKPWLDARLGVSPPAPDLAAKGFTLVGGRVDVLGQQVVPALVYRHNEHTITLFALPDGSGRTAPRDFASGGYNMVRWSAVGFGFTAVSDLEADELDSFVADYRAESGPGGTARQPN
jgi:anti-sigma factor RsiW